jgi:tRNA pseudouridine38-40 synthase
MAKPTLNPESGFRRFIIELAYDGTHYSGWGKQPEQEGVRTIQGALEEALAKIVRGPVATIVAGRTDAGVHALHQIAHVDILDTELDIDHWPYRLNRILDEDIRIISVRPAPPHFHARFSALSRTYIYKIADAQRALPPLERFDIAPWYRHLDEAKMNEASSLLLGEHDFRAFCKYREGGTTIRTLQKFHWSRDEKGYLIAEVRADAFCYSMVRNLVGGVVCVGEGRADNQWLMQMLVAQERVPDSYVFPARGLTLASVEYPADDQLLLRAERTMARRDEDM